MAAVSASQTTSTLTPPSSSHGVQSSWSYSGQQQDSTRSKEENSQPHPPSRKLAAIHTNGSSLTPQISRPDLSQKRSDTLNSSHSSKSGQVADANYLAPARVSALNRKDSNISDSGSGSDSLLDLYGSHSANKSGMNSMDLGERNGTGDFYENEEDPERSRWIHRDKLARIESQELQAAGIILPRARAPSKSSRRERSRDQYSNGLGKSDEADQKRQRIAEAPPEEAEEHQESAGWDLRTPEEAAEDKFTGWRDYSNGQKGLSRIPLFTESPLPMALEHIARDTPITRSRGLSVDDESIAFPKARSRSHSVKYSDEDAASSPTKLTSESSPSKKPMTPGSRKGTAPATRITSNTSTNSATRPKTRSGPKDANSRPGTRSGELNMKAPEGDPPWLENVYKPDPRLPPDQQMLPTVAKRLQQERWEKEGKFGTAYDKEFRPINDEQLPQQAEVVQQTVITSESKLEDQAEWPLRTPKSPTLSTGRPGTAGGYSTIPKIQDMPQSPLQSKPQNSQPLRIQDPPEEDEKKKGGCGCCVVM